MDISAALLTSRDAPEPGDSNSLHMNKGKIVQVIGPVVDVEFSGARLDPSRYAWDGHVLWLVVEFDKSVKLDIRFRA